MLAVILAVSLAVNRSLRPVQILCSEFAERWRLPPFAMVYHRRCCTFVAQENVDFRVAR
jgi:hypothetical protein